MLEDWSVGLMLAPRKGAIYVNKTIESCYKAGWSDITVFAEPNSPPTPSSKRVQRPSKFGNWLNFKQSLTDMFNQNQNKKYYMLIEDDVVFAKNVRQFLDCVLWPENTGVCSVYCPSHYETFERAGWNNHAGLTTWGAVTMIFSNESLQSFISYYNNNTWHSDQMCDNAVGKWCMYTNKNAYFFSPALAQHVGVKSSLSAKKYHSKRYSTLFVGEEFDCMMLLCGDGNDRFERDN